MALFIAMLAFHNAELMDSAKVAILATSIFAAVVAAILLRLANKRARSR